MIAQLNNSGKNGFHFLFNRNLQNPKIYFLFIVSNLIKYSIAADDKNESTTKTGYSVNLFPLISL